MQFSSFSPPLWVISQRVLVIFSLQLVSLPYVGVDAIFQGMEIEEKKKRCEPAPSFADVARGAWTKVPTVPPLAAAESAPTNFNFKKTAPV